MPALPNISELREFLVSGDLATEDIADRVLSSQAEYREHNAFVACSDMSDFHEQLVNSSIIGGPLSGVPYSVKDNILTKRFATTIGTDFLSTFNPNVDAVIVERLDKAGACLFGKNNMPEFCQSMTSDNPNYGTTRNPVNSDWITGGSSSGSAVAVGVGTVSFSIGTDTGGSVRIPAALCGCVGFRPSTGRYATEGIVPVSPTFDSPGIIATRVEEIGIVDCVLSMTPIKNDVDPDLSNLRIGLPHDYFFENLDPHVASSMSMALDLIGNAGVTFLHEPIADLPDLNSQVGFPIAFYEMLRETAVFLARHDGPSDIRNMIEGVRGAVERAALRMQFEEMAIPYEIYRDALAIKLPCCIQLVNSYFDRYNLDALIVPTTPIAAVDRNRKGEIGEIELNGIQVPAFQTYVRNVEPFSNYGGPCITLPIHSDGVRPVGLEIVGRGGADRKILRLAQKIETLFA